jgi:uncharacterized protein involved in exopolysaccharide biosynthesis
MGSAQNYVSVTRRQPDIEDYIDMLRRYRSWVVGPTFAGLVIAVVVAFCWPDTFESRAVMRITPQAVPATLVEGVGMNSMAQRLDQMTVQILGRSSLMGLIQEPALDLYKKERAHLTLDEVAENMRIKDVKIRLYEASGGATTSRGSQAFEIRFRYTDRFKAQAVVREITSKFQEYNFTLQHTQADTTAHFLTDELKKAKERMDAAEQQLAQLAAQHPGELPQDAATNTTLVNSKEQEIHSIEDSIGRSQSQKLENEIQLQNLRLAEADAANNVEQTQITPNVSLRNDRVLNLDRTINDANQRLRGLQVIYKDDYPEVKSQRAYIKTLEDQRAELEKADSASPVQAAPQSRVVRNPQAIQKVQELQAAEKLASGAISNLQAEIDRGNKRLGQLQNEQQNLQAKMAASPGVFQRYNELQGEFTLAKQAYDSESKTRDRSQTAESLEEHHAGETLDLLEAADLPETAAEPNRWAIIGLGTFIGLLAGCGMAGAKELKNTTLKNLKDVRAYTNLPVLSSVPLLENALLVRRKRRLAWLAWSSAIVIGGILMSGAAYYYVAGRTGPS